MTASGDQTIRMWDVNRDQCLAVFKGHSCSVKSVDFREDEICEYHGLMSVFFHVGGYQMHYSKIFLFRSLRFLINNNNLLFLYLPSAVFIALMLVGQSNSHTAF